MSLSFNRATITERGRDEILSSACISPRTPMAKDLEVEVGPLSSLPSLASALGVIKSKDKIKLSEY